MIRTDVRCAPNRSRAHKRRKVLRLGGKGEKGAAYKETGCPVPIGDRLVAEPMGLAQNWQRRSTVPSGRLGGSRASTLTDKERIHEFREWFMKGACQGELIVPGQILPMPLQIGGFRLRFATSKQVKSHAKWLATLAGRQDLPWQPILESSCTERGRVSAPGSSDNDRTCAASRSWPAISRTDSCVLELRRVGP